MSQMNYTRKLAPTFTAEGARAAHITPVQQLRRLVMSCMLWGDNFYIDGKSVADLIKNAVHSVPLADAGAIAVEARTKMKLRHVPLLIVREMARHPKLKTNPKAVSEALATVIQRPDELSEFVSIYWKDGKCPLSKQVKLGLAKAFQKFNEYNLAKYNRKKDIMLRDVLFLCHSKPADVPQEALPWAKDERAGLKSVDHYTDQGLWYTHEFRPDGFSEGEILYGKLIYDQLEVPDTWEVELSAGADKRATFVRLMAENKLGDLAFLRNLRNMVQAGVQNEIIKDYGETRNWGRVLPFRFIAAARVVPQLEPVLERWMFKCLEGTTMLPGHTVLCIDVSGSMNDRLSAKSDLNRLDAAKALAILLREICENVTIYKFDTSVELVAPRRGFALGDAIGGPRGGTDIGKAVMMANSIPHDRLIVLTDEQSHTRVGPPRGLGYMINVASNKNGIGYGPWLHVDGFSEAIIDYIQYFESEE